MEQSKALADLLKNFTDEIEFIDDTAQIILKGHLVAEGLMNEALENYTFHTEHLSDARLQFHQKIELCKAFSLSDNKNNMWNLLKKINLVRNVLSHSLDKNRRVKVIQELKSAYDQEFGPKSRNIDEMSEEATICLLAISGVLGFLHQFLEEAKRFKDMVKFMDKSMNKCELSKDS
jgi:hypothetical protein